MSLEDLKRIVNPYNGSRTTPSSSSRWRCSRSRGSSTTAGVACGKRSASSKDSTLLTPLKYFPYEDPKRPFEAILEYDLDKSAIDTGDGKVTVDRGYIRMESKDPAITRPLRACGSRPGKIVHITGIPPWVQARLVCSCGYGTSSADFLLEAARKNPQGTKPFLFFTSDADAKDAKRHGALVGALLASTADPLRSRSGRSVDRRRRRPHQQLPAS